MIRETQTDKKLVVFLTLEYHESEDRILMLLFYSQDDLPVTEKPPGELLLSLSVHILPGSLFFHRRLSRV